MPLAPLAVPRYPAVPRAPGVPAVLRTIGAVENKVVSVVADLRLILNALRPPQWGIFDKRGAAVVTADSVLGVDLRKEFRVPDFPIEAGGFANYNKVETPFDVRITFAQAGTDAARSALLAAIDRAAKLLELYTVVTPEFVYPSCNLIHYDYRRQAREGATLLQVDVWLQEIRIVRAGKFTSAKDPAAADTVSMGTVQAQSPADLEAAYRTPDASGTSMADRDRSAYLGWLHGNPRAV